MVRDAPVFAEIADSFMTFMGDGIFVAHNVNFDYGFISYEYERLERRFRFPKLCTCAGMRRKYPGHESYGLGNLCQLYEIELESHHRALCDARAAGHLLNLINSKRIDEMERLRRRRKRLSRGVRRSAGEALEKRDHHRRASCADVMPSGLLTRPRAKMASPTK